MRHLLDTYIQAEPSETLELRRRRLVQLIVERGAGAIDELPEGIRKDPEAVAETIENNIRKLIIDERPINPKYYERMSELLDALIVERRQEAIDYKEYLAKLLEQAAKLGTKRVGRRVPGLGRQRCPAGALSTSSSRMRTLPVEIDKAVRHYQARLLGRQPDQGDEGQAGHPRLSFPRTSTALDELFELVKARHEYR